MIGRLRILSVALALIGIGFPAAGALAHFKTQEGYRSLNAYSSAQNVTLEYSAGASWAATIPPSCRRSWHCCGMTAIPGRGLGPQP